MSNRKTIFFLAFFFIILFVSGALFLFGGNKEKGSIWSIVPNDFVFLIGTQNIDYALSDLKKCPLEVALKENNRKEFLKLRKYLYFFSGEAVFCTLTENWFSAIDLGYKSLMAKAILKFLSEKEKNHEYSIKQIKFKDNTIFQIISPNNVSYHVIVYDNYLIVAGSRNALFEVIGCILNNKPCLLKQNIPFKVMNSIFKKFPFYALMNKAYNPASSSGEPAYKTSFATFSAKNLQFDYYINDKHDKPYNFIKKTLSAAQMSGLLNSEKKKEYSILSYNISKSLPIGGLNLYYSEKDKKFYGSNSMILFKDIDPNKINDPMYIEIEPSTILFIMTIALRALNVNPDYQEYLKVLKQFSKILLLFKDKKINEFLDFRAKIILKVK